MSYTNGTTHYNLPQTTGSDKRDWSDTNQAFADVDAALYGAVQDMAQAELDIDALETRMDTAEQNIATNTGDISGLDTRITTVEGAVSSLSGQITDTRQDLEDMICAFNEASATSTHAYAIGDYFIYNDVLYRAIQAIAIGDTIVPDTNCTTTNVTTELSDIDDLSGDVAALQTDVGNLQTDVGNLQTTIVYQSTSGGEFTATVAPALHFLDDKSLEYIRHCVLLVDNHLYHPEYVSNSLYNFTSINAGLGGNDIHMLCLRVQRTPSWGFNAALDAVLSSNGNNLTNLSGTTVSDVKIMYH